MIRCEKEKLRQLIGKEAACGFVPKCHYAINILTNCSRMNPQHDHVCPCVSVSRSCYEGWKCLCNYFIHTLFLGEDYVARFSHWPLFVFHVSDVQYRRRNGHTHHVSFWQAYRGVHAERDGLDGGRRVWRTACDPDERSGGTSDRGRRNITRTAEGWERTPSLKGSGFKRLYRPLYLQQSIVATVQFHAIRWYLHSGFCRPYHFCIPFYFRWRASDMCP